MMDSTKQNLLPENLSTSNAEFLQLKDFFSSYKTQKSVQSLSQFQERKKMLDLFLKRREEIIDLQENDRIMKYAHIFKPFLTKFESQKKLKIQNLEQEAAHFSKDETNQNNCNKLIERLVRFSETSKKNSMIEEQDQGQTTNIEMSSAQDSLVGRSIVVKSPRLKDSNIEIISPKSSEVKVKKVGSLNSLAFMSRRSKTKLILRRGSSQSPDFLLSQSKEQLKFISEEKHVDTIKKVKAKIYTGIKNHNSTYRASGHYNELEDEDHILMHRLSVQLPSPSKQENSNNLIVQSIQKSPTRKNSQDKFRFSLKSQQSEASIMSKIKNQGSLESKPHISKLPNLGRYFAKEDPCQISNQVEEEILSFLIKQDKLNPLQKEQFLRSDKTIQKQTSCSMESKILNKLSTHYQREQIVNNKNQYRLSGSIGNNGGQQKSKRVNSKSGFSEDSKQCQTSRCLRNILEVQKESSIEYINESFASYTEIKSSQLYNQSKSIQSDIRKSQIQMDLDEKEKNLKVNERQMYIYQKRLIRKGRYLSFIFEQKLEKQLTQHRGSQIPKVLFNDIIIFFIQKIIMNQSPQTSRYHNKAFGSIINKFIRVIESLVSIKDQNEECMVLKIEHSLIHELASLLSTIFNNGIDNSSYDQQLTPHMSTPMIATSERSKGMLDSQRFIPQQRSLRFVNSLSFLKNDKLRGSIWLLCELSDGHIVKIFEQFANHLEFSAKYYQHSIMKMHHEVIRENLELIYNGMFVLQGEIITRYQQFCQIDQQFQMRDLPLIQSHVHIEEDHQTPRYTTILAEPLPSPDIEPKHNTAIIEKMNTSSHSREDAYKSSTMKMMDVKTKHSVLLYSSQFEKYAEDSTYQLFQKEQKEQRLSVQNYICFSCQSQIKQGFYPFITKTAFLCSYSGRWFCQACMHKEGIIIPYRAVKQFDLKPYPVSKISFQNIKQLYTKPILVLHYFEDIVFVSNQLHDFLLQKRQLHLMYDSYCRVELFDQIPELQRRKNLLLTINLFSLKDLEQIKDGSLGVIQQAIYDKGLKHMKECDVCQQNAFTCPGCKIVKKIFAFDIKNTQYCRSCKSLYHRSCFPEDCKICCQKTTFQP